MTFLLDTANTLFSHSSDFIVCVVMILAFSYDATTKVNAGTQEMP